MMSDVSLKQTLEVAGDLISGRHRERGTFEFLIQPPRLTIGLAITQRGVADPGKLIGQGAGRFVVIGALLNV